MTRLEIKDRAQGSVEVKKELGYTALFSILKIIFPSIQPQFDNNKEEKNIALTKIGFYKHIETANSIEATSILLRYASYYQ